MYKNAPERYADGGIMFGNIINCTGTIRGRRNNFRKQFKMSRNTPWTRRDVCAWGSEALPMITIMLLSAFRRNP